MATMLPRVKACYECAGTLVGLPYVFSGGHNLFWLPSLGYAEGILAPGSGIDCSSGVSLVLRAGGMCWYPRPLYPLATGNFIGWGLPGPGRWMTLWVRNDFQEEHVGLQFVGIGAHSWWQAANDGLPTGHQVGWITLDTTGMEPRHWPNT